MLIDVAYHEGRINWCKARENGVEGAYIRFATGFGRGAGDPAFFRNCELAQASGMKWSVYHVPALADPDVHTQAEVYGDTLKLLIKHVGLSLDAIEGPMGDWEAFAKFLASQNRPLALRYWDTVSQAIGRPLGTYTRASWWDRYIGKAGFEEQSKLWVAHPGAITPTIPRAWKDAGKTWTLWQYRWDGRVIGIPGAVDLNKRNPALVPPA